MIMNVGELIDFLEAFAPEKYVLMQIAEGGGFFTIADVMAYDGFPILCIKRDEKQ